MIDRIFEILAEITDRAADEFHAEDNLLTDVGMSSFEIIQLMAAIEQEYDIRIPTRELSSFTTPKSIADYIEKVKK